jgi:hypothetical protein
MITLEQELQGLQEELRFSKSFRNIKKYLKEITKKQFKKGVSEKELDVLTDFLKNTDTYNLYKDGVTTQIRFLQNDLINVGLFEDILESSGLGNLASWINDHTNFKNLKIVNKKYDINLSNEIGASFRVINEYFEKNPTTDRYVILPMVILIYKVFKLNTHKLKQKVDLNLIKYFFSNENYLTNTQAFWVVFNQLWQTFDMNHIFSNQWLEVFSKYDRLEGGYVDRTILANGDCLGKGTRDFVDKLKDSNKEITVYRGFLTRQNHFVRKGIKKINNPFAEQQEEGSGLSYSINKDISIFFACRYHFFSDYILKKNLPSLFGKITEDSMRDEIKKMIGTRISDDYLKKEVRRTIVTCKLNTKDIIFAQVLGGEFEIIADPNNVKLKRYDFINDKTRFEALRRKSSLGLINEDRLECEKKAFFGSKVSQTEKMRIMKLMSEMSQQGNSI